MKGQTLRLFSLAIAISCIPARGQDSNSVQGLNRDVNGLDASIHAGLDEHQEAQPPQDVGKRPTTSASPYSQSPFQSVGEAPTTLFWPAQANISTSIAKPSDGKNRSNFSNPIFRAGAQSPVSTRWSFHATDNKIARESDGNSANLVRQPGPFRSLGIGRTEDDSIGPQPYKTKNPLLTRQPETAGFPAPFREKQFGPTSDSSSLSYPFPKFTFSSKRPTTKQHKRPPRQQLADSTRSRPDRGTLSTNEN